MIERAPTARAVVEKLAVVPEIVPMPSTVVPSLNVTVPVGEDPPDSVAVKVTEAPSAGAVSEADTVIVGAELPTTIVYSAKLAPPIVPAAQTVKVNVPACVGVPVMAPVEISIVRPSGRSVELSIENSRSPLPPVAEIDVSL